MQHLEAFSCDKEAEVELYAKVECFKVSVGSIVVYTDDVNVVSFKN